MVRFTKDGLEKIKKEFEDLSNSRPEAVLDLKQAREKGDLSENGHYKAARGKLSSIDSRLKRLKETINNARLIEKSNNKYVGIGNTVILLDGKTYEIVGDLEANPREGKISLLSPLGKSLQGKKAGDKISLKTPKEEKILIIKSVN